MGSQSLFLILRESCSDQQEIGSDVGNSQWRVQTVLVRPNFPKKANQTVRAEKRVCWLLPALSDDEVKLFIWHWLTTSVLVK